MTTRTTTATPDAGGRIAGEPGFCGDHRNAMLLAQGTSQLDVQEAHHAG